MQDREIVAHMLVAQSLVNALFHLAAWIAPGDYAPGAVVSVPATGYFFAWVRRQARATAAELILAVAVGTVVAAVAIGFLSCLTAAPVPSGQRSNRAVPHNQTISQNAGALHGGSLDARTTSQPIQQSRLLASARVRLMRATAIRGGQQPPG